MRERVIITSQTQTGAAAEKPSQLDLQRNMHRRAGLRAYKHPVVQVAAITAIFVGACVGKALSASLPDVLLPPAPFPLVTQTTIEREFVAPGVTRATYHIRTSAGPLVAYIVLVDPSEPTVRLGSVTAHDRIFSSGETVASMAARTGAVFGLNADYFDIGNTYVPIGIVARDGALSHSPGAQVAFTYARDKSVRFERYRFAGTAALEDGPPVPLAAVGDWPSSQTNASFLTPAYAGTHVPPSVSVADLDSLGGERYRVRTVHASGDPGTGIRLAYGAASGLAPAVGATLHVHYETNPQLNDVDFAVGGGPLLLAAGAPVDDPASPLYNDRRIRIPIAAAARFADGTIAFIAVDGRKPLESIGLRRDEAIAFMRGLGASDAMQFDSGGSTSFVARVLGESRPRVLNDPTDGLERPVADGVFVYSDAPAGPPSRLVVRPNAMIALPGAQIPLRASVTDRAGHALGAATGPWHVHGGGARIEGNTLVAGTIPGDYLLTISRGELNASVPLTVVANVAKLTIDPERPNPDSGATITLHAAGEDTRGRAVTLDPHVRWSADRGRITADGAYTAGNSDARVTAMAGGATTTIAIRVGRHRERFGGFAEPFRPIWKFSTVPKDGAGALAFDESGLRLTYDFTANTRAAYAGVTFTLGDPLAMTCTIDGDGNGVALRMALLDRYGKRDVLTFARSVDWSGAQRHEIKFPTTLVPPLVLQSFYTVGTLGNAPVHAAGTLGIRDCELLLPGSAPPAP
ncbi:MAG: hypothetical protein NVS2B17_07860 [Candidatus Velthaea sp.]